MSDELDLPKDLFERVEYPEEVLLMGGGPVGDFGEAWRADEDCGWITEIIFQDITWAFKLMIDRYYEIRSYFLDMDSDFIRNWILYILGRVPGNYVLPLLLFYWFTGDFHEEYTGFIDWLREFDWFDAVTSNDYNPFYFGVEFYIEWVNWGTKVFLKNEANLSFDDSLKSAPSDEWAEVFEDVYDFYWLQFVYTATPMV